MKRVAAAQYIGSIERERVQAELAMCPGNRGEPIRFTTDRLGNVMDVPCDACARKAGRPPIRLVRPEAVRIDEDLERELGEVLLFFTTKWGAGTSGVQRRRLKATVDRVLARIQLPALELPARLVPPAPRPPRAPSSPKAKAAPTCVRCGVPLPYTPPGRPPKYCTAHRPAKYVQTNARRAAARLARRAAE